MKRLRLIAVFFLSLFLLNAAGYYWLLAETYQRNREEAHIFWQERQNAREDLVTMKIPLSVPYLQGSAEFEATSGQVKFQGEYYQLVQQKLYNDTLYVVCVRDGQAKARHQALAEFVQQFSHTDADDDQDAAAPVKHASAEYMSHTIVLTSLQAGWVSDRLFFLSAALSPKGLHDDPFIPPPCTV